MAVRITDCYRSISFKNAFLITELRKIRTFFNKAIVSISRAVWWCERRNLVYKSKIYVALGLYTMQKLEQSDKV